ncbi:MAG: GNAT family N-acetyltransferase [Aestuariivirga sp.]
MTGDSQATISIFSADDIASHIRELGALLHACVHDGAGVSFVLPFMEDESEAFWNNKVLTAVRGGGLALLVARQSGRITGSVQLDHDTPPNQPHRAEVRKLLVHPDFRRRGLAKALMAELERLALQLGRSLITLDTRTGDMAEPLYTSLGYKTVGMIPGYARNTIEDRLDSTTIMYKLL